MNGPDLSMPGGMPSPEAVRGERPDGAGGVHLGEFRCLAAARPEIVADCVIGTHLGDRATELDALRRFRWVAGISNLDNAMLGAAAANFRATGLVRLTMDDGERYWERAAIKATPARPINLPPAPVEVVPADAPRDRALERVGERQRAQEDEHIRAVVRDELARRGL